jgi:hypothetical protein
VAVPPSPVDTIFLFLVALRFLQDGGQRRIVHEWRVDGVLIGVHDALHDAFPEPVRRVDDGGVGEAGLRVNREEDPRLVGPDHLLDAHRQGHLVMVEPLLFAVADGAVGEEGGKAPLAGREHGAGPAHIQVTFLLPREAGVGQILGRGTAAHRDVDRVGPVGGAEGMVRLPDRLGHAVGEAAIPNLRADGRTGLAERLLPGGPRVELRPNVFGQAIGLQEPPVGVGCRGEPVGHADATLL